METTVIRVNGYLPSDYIFNGFALTNFKYGYEDLPSNQNFGLGIYGTGNVVAYVVNGKLAFYSSSWGELTPDETVTNGNDVIRKYTISLETRKYFPSRGTERIIFTCDSGYIWPYFVTVTSKYIDNVIITLGEWMQAIEGSFYVSPLNTIKPVSFKEWTDILNIQYSSEEGQMRLPRNVYGNIEDLGPYILKVFEKIDYLYIQIYGSGGNIIGTSLSPVVNYLAANAAAGKSVKLYINKFSSDQFYNKTIYFDGNGGWSFDPIG